jgi:hypothetical protein
MMNEKSLAGASGFLAGVLLVLAGVPAARAQVVPPTIPPRPTPPVPYSTDWAVPWAVPPERPDIPPPTPGRPGRPPEPDTTPTPRPDVMVYPMPGGVTPQVYWRTDGSLTLQTPGETSEIFWLEVAYRLAWVQGTPLPGGGRTASDARSGLDFQGGGWLDEARGLGFEGVFSWLAGQRGSGGAAIPTVGLAATPLGLDAHSNDLWNAEANIRQNLARGEGYRVDALFGYRFLALSESLSVSGPVTLDRVRTENHWHLGQVGLDAEQQDGAWIVGATVKVGLGLGQQTAAPLGARQLDRETTVLVPEAALRLGYQMTDTVRLWGGYRFLYLSNLARPGDQVNLTAQGVTPARIVQSTDAWVQGLEAALELRY